MTTTELQPVHQLGVVRCALTGAVALGVLFLACWVGTAIPGLSVTHAFISLFTPQPVDSVAALGEGGFWAIVFGAFAAALLAAVYNLFAFLGRR